MAWVPAAIGAIASVAGGLLGQNQSRDDATTAFNRQMALDKYLGQNQIQWRVSDLEKAGLNKVLAAPGAFGGIPTQMAPQAQGGGQALSQGISGAVSSALSAQQQVAQIAQTKAQTLATTAQTAVFNQEVSNKQAEYYLTVAQMSESASRSVLSQAQADQVRAAIKNVEADTGLKIQDMTTKEINNRFLEAMKSIELDSATTLAAMQRLGIPQAKAIADWWTAHPELAPWLNSASTATGVLKNVAGLAK